MSQWGALGYAVDHAWSTEQILAHLVTVQGPAIGVTTQPARVQVGGQPVRPVDNVPVAVAPLALGDQRAIGYNRRDGFGDGGNGEHRGFVSHGWSSFR